MHDFVYVESLSEEDRFSIGIVSFCEACYVTSPTSDILHSVGFKKIYIDVLGRRNVPRRDPPSPQMGVD